jgi:hypothetical protein
MILLLFPGNPDMHELVGPEKALICLYCYIITAKAHLFSTKKALSGFTQPGRFSPAFFLKK